MLREEDITIRIKCQQYESKGLFLGPDGTEAVIVFDSLQRTEDVSCPFCGGKAYIHEQKSTYLKDMPVWHGQETGACVIHHRYRCQRCKATFAEGIPMQYPGTRITTRAAQWVKGFLRQKLSVRAVQLLTGIHWDTVRRIHKEMMDEALKKRDEQLKAEGYKPRYLAVDEFAIHKGHTYATCVMDLETGDVLWVGNGRSKEDFSRFFEEYDNSLLTDVIAVAMDMNASYNVLVEEHLPWAKIVYDRYHMQAQYGKDVLGVVRLEEARKHKTHSQELWNRAKEEADLVNSRQIRSEAKAEKQKYGDLKRLRWTLLKRKNRLSTPAERKLNEILESHSDLAVCYVMKEEMCRLFSLTDGEKAAEGWRSWFEAAKASSIPALVRFAELKEKRLNGLIAHAEHPISTGRLEGFNNKIKVAKRVGYGYRDDSYFFTLVRFLALPSKTEFHLIP